jgi:transcription antitermination factor NusG
MINWYIVHTKAKWERKVAQELNKLGIECYCPLITQERQWSDRKKKLIVPLFSGSVFVKLPAETDRNIVFLSSGVVRFLFWLGKPAVILDDEINALKKWLDTIENNDISVMPFQIGDRKQLDSDLSKIKKLIVLSN